MAIQVYQKKTSALKIANPYQGSQIASSAIGVQANKTSQLANAFNNAGQALIKVVAEERARTQEAQVLSAYNQLQKDTLEFEANYSATNQGIDAATASKDYETFVTQRAQELGVDMGSKALESFQQKASGVVLNAFSRGLGYERAQKEIYNKDVYDALVSTHEQLVAQQPDNYQAIAQSANTIHEAQKTLFPGRDYTSMNATLEKKTATQMISSALANGDTKKAESLFNELGPKLGADAPAMQLRITKLAEARDAKALKAKEQAKKNEYAESVNTSYNNILTVIAEVPSEDQGRFVAEMIAKEPDPKKRKDLQDFWNHDAKLIKMSQDSVDESERARILADDKSSYSQRIEQVQNNTSMSPEAKDRLIKDLAGGPPATNTDDYALAMRQINSSTFKTEAEVRRALDPLTITNKDKEKLISTWTTLNKNEDAKTTVANIKTTMTALGVPEDEQAQVQTAFTQWLALENEQGRPPSAVEQDKYMRQLTAQAATGRSSWFGFGSQKNTVGVELALIPLDAQREIGKALKEKGFTNVTPSMIIQEWNRDDNAAYRDEFTYSD